MPYELKFERDGIGAVATWTGTVTMDEVFSVRDTLYSKVHLPMLRYQLFDYSNADLISPETTPHDVHKIALQDREISIKNPNIIFAAVGSPTFFSGWETFYKTYIDILAKEFGFQFEFFQDIESARVWIDNTLRDREIL